MNMQGGNAGGKAMPTMAEQPSASGSARWLGRGLSGLVILFLLFDGAVKLVPWPVVTETMDRIGYGASESLARSLGIIAVSCAGLCALPPIPIVGHLLLTGCLGCAMASLVRTGIPSFSHILCGVYPGGMVRGGLGLRGRKLRASIPPRNRRWQ